MRILTDKPRQRPASFGSSAFSGLAQDDEIVRTEAKALENAVTAGLQVRVLLAEPLDSPLHSMQWRGEFAILGVRGQASGRLDRGVGGN